MEKTVLTSDLQNLDTAQLYAQCTIEEIRNVEKKTRREIERKKEDLRIMVGERYRDLIEAADTIKDMKHGIDKIVQSVSDIQAFCSQLKYEQKHINGPAGKCELSGQNKHYRSAYFSIAAQIKLLMDMPDKLWRSQEREDFIHAVLLYQLASFMYNKLSHEKWATGRMVLSAFPVVTRQWHTIKQFRKTILKACKSKLRCADVTDKCITECMAAMIVLEKGSKKLVFQEFLKARLESIEEVFSSKGELGSKQQLVLVCHVIYKSIEQVHSVFAVRENMLDDVLSDLASGEKSLSEQALRGDSMYEDVMSLCDDVARCKLHLPPDTSDLAGPDLHQALATWVEECGAVVTEQGTSLLHYVNTIRALASIRDEVWDTLAQEKNHHEWPKICEELLTRPISIWSDFLEPLLLERVKLIISRDIEQSVADVMEAIDGSWSRCGEEDRSACDESLMDLRVWLWSDGGEEIGKGSGWARVASSGHPPHPSQLKLKALAYTSLIQGFCVRLETGLKHVVEDINEYVKSDVASTFTPSLSQQQVFDKLSHVPELQGYLQSRSREAVDRFTQYVEAKLDEMKVVVQGEDGDFPSTIPLKCLVFGRVCSGVIELCPHLCTCITGLKLDRSLKRYGRRGSSAVKRVEEVEAAWSECKGSLEAVATKAFHMWVVCLSKQASALLTNILSGMDDITRIRNTPAWDDIVIEEESESGEKVKSTISVPAQPTWFLQTFLHNICKQVTQVGGHALKRVALYFFIQELEGLILHSYEEWITETVRNGNMSQSAALQISFDIRFISSFMKVEGHYQDRRVQEREDVLRSEANKSIQYLETFVDPFDLDVFLSHIRANVSKCCLHAKLIFGMLSLASSAGSKSAKPSAGGATSSTDKHNVLNLNNNPPRISLLPVATLRRNLTPVSHHPSPSGLTPGSQGSKFSFKPLSSSKTSPALGLLDSLSMQARGHTADDGGIGLKSGKVTTSAAFYLNKLGAMSSSWFGYQQNK